MNDRSGMRYLLVFALCAGCASNEPGNGTPDSGTGSAPDPSSNFGNADATVAPPTPDAGNDPGSQLDPCQTVDVRNVDLLFMVDNSASMAQEQESLRREFPELIRTLTTGDRDGDGSEDFPPVANLHLGVVSSDMGLPGITGIDGCSGLGDDGILRNVPDATVTGCAATYPLFLDFVAGEGDPDAIATDFGCIASLGTAGCGFEQQLESVLKAVWPEDDVDPATDAPRDPNRISFLGDGLGFGTVGHGDGLNAGFLRPNRGEDISVVAIVVVTDEEDCSSRDTKHFTPESDLDPSDPLTMQDLNLRCFYNKDQLYPLVRYSEGYKLLREGNDQLVVFAAIAGVPPDLVEADVLASVDFSDEAARDAFYDAILGDERMQEMVDETRPPGNGNLIPSCDVPDRGVAYPPRRIVEVARSFGERGLIQSICQDDFGPAMDVLVNAIGQTIGEACIVQ